MVNSIGTPDSYVLLAIPHIDFFHLMQETTEQRDSEADTWKIGHVRMTCLSGIEVSRFSKNRNCEQQFLEKNQFAYSLGRKLVCNKFSESSTGLLGQHGSCSTAPRPGDVSENMIQNLGNKLPRRPILYLIK